MIVVKFAMETVRHALLLQWPSQKTGKRGVNKLLNFNGFNLESKKGPFPILMWIRLVTANKVLFLFYFPPKDEKVASIFTRSALPEGSWNDAWGNSPKHDGTGCSTYSSDLQTKKHTGKCSKKDTAALVWFCCSCFNCPRSVWISDETAFRVVLYALKRFSC